MAPARGRDASVEETTEYETFIEELRVFHADRGTSFDPSPKVGNRRVDLLRLYKRVVGDGGYDVVSDTKSSKLAWRTIGQEFNLATTNLPALAFSLKTVYYRNLAAYEIVNVHKKKPPPKEILEDVSAKGGNLLNRTLENYTRPLSRDERFANGMDQDGSDEEGQRTPKEERMEVDEPGSTGRRSLRQAPPQRVLFQPDLSSSRQSRQQMGLAKSPTPSGNLYSGMNGYNAAYASNGVPQTLANYEPKQQFPLTLRPVVTPSNNPEAFKAYRLAYKDSASARHGKQSQQAKSVMLPGTGFTGPSIYVRTLLSLQSGIPAEQEYALHHLVKISHERGDKYRFDGFPGLAEALIEKVLEISSLLGGVEWKIDYDYHPSNASDEALDGLNGTLDILDKVKSVKMSRISDRIQTEDASRRLALINEAGLVLRNMVMLEENAEYISKYPSIRDLIIILINLPDNGSNVELRYYGFEMAEQLTKYFPAKPEDPLLLSLMEAVDCSDRATILTSLRAISRMGTYLEQVIPLQAVPLYIIHRLYEWLLIEDQELRGACLDFLYRFTAVVENVDLLLNHTDLEVLVRQVSRLLLHGAQTLEEKHEPPPKVAPPKPPPPVEDAPIPRISLDLIEQLLGYDEPERSSQWLRTCFEEDPAGEITQIALWQAYQIPFAPYGSQRPLLPAKDFITNVSTTFSHASAQVMNGPTPRFVIKGIRPRTVPVDPRGRAYMRCLWHFDNGIECGEFAQGPKQMWEHVVSAHLNITKGTDGLFNFTPKDSRLYSCHWAGCQRFTQASDAVSPFAVGMHVKTHLPDSSSLAWQRAKHNVIIPDPDAEDPATPAAAAAPAADPETRSWAMYNTLTDERNDAAGLPLTSALILRNLARNIPKTDTAALRGSEALLWSIFAPIGGQLYYVMAHNQPLREYLSVLAPVVAANV